MTSTFADRWGAGVRASNGAAVALLDQAVEDLVALAGDPVGGADAAIAADGDLALARIYRAYLSLYGTSAVGASEASALIKPLEAEPGPGAEPLPAREAQHLAAARAWADGDWQGAARALERALVANPRDLLALKVAQDLYFFTGNRLELRDVAGRVLPAWQEDDQAWGYVQGIWAFGLEENGDYRGAAAAASNALARNPKDVWGVHALAHVFEMEGSHEPGVSFLCHLVAGLGGQLLRRAQLVAPRAVPARTRPGQRRAGAVPRADPDGEVHRVAGRRGRGRAAVAAVAVRHRRDRPRRPRWPPTSPTWWKCPPTSSTTGTR